MWTPPRKYTHSRGVEGEGRNVRETFAGRAQKAAWGTLPESGRLDRALVGNGIVVRLTSVLCPFCQCMPMPASPGLMFTKLQLPGNQSIIAQTTNFLSTNLQFF